MIDQMKRFWDKVRKTPECWLWIGAKTGGDRGGYGNFALGGRNRGAHIIAYTLMYGPIPEGLCVCHSCDNPICVRPTHLSLKTHKGNMDDRDSKGRLNPARGEAHWKAKLTEKNVLEIFYSPDSLRVLARKFGVSHQQIAWIKKGKSWSWLTAGSRGLPSSSTADDEHPPE